MLLEENQSDLLKQWMVLRLRPICDADHEVLSEYIMALLRHDQPENELLASCSKQLEDFLQQDTKLFVADLFDHLRAYGAFSGSYQPPKLDLSTSNVLKKRSLTVDEPYLTTSLLNSLENQLPKSSAPIPQYTPTQSHPSFLHFPEPQPNPLKPSSHFSNPSVEAYVPTFNQQRNSKRPRKSGFCRDYHYRGYCARGGNCHFSHDDKDPSSSSSASLSSAYYPKSLTGETEPTAALPASTCLSLAFTPSITQQIPGLGGPLPVLCDLSSSFSTNSRKPAIDRSNSQDSRHTDRIPRLEPNLKKSNTSLVIENIPQSSLSDRAVRDYFSHFGPLSSVSVDVYNAQAIVTFHSLEDAKRAHSSPEPVFNNRFVRVHFKRLNTSLPRRHLGPQRTGAKDVDPSTHNGSIEHHNSSNNGYHPIRSYDKPTPASLTATSINQSSPSSPSQLPPDVHQLSQRQQELREKIEAQKRLLEKLSLKKAQKDQNGKLNHQNTSTDITTPAKLDSDLSNLLASSIEDQVKDNGNVAESKEPDPVTDIKHASPESHSHLNGSDTKPVSPGITDSNSFKKTAPTYVNRGGRKLMVLPRNSRTSWVANAASNNTPTTSFKLDNRSCTLAIKDVPSSDSRDLVKNYLEKFGQVVSVSPLGEDDGSSDLRVQFATRAAAENALASGTEIPEVGRVTMNWISTTNTTATTTTTTTTMTSPTTNGPQTTLFIPGLRNSHHYNYTPGSFTLINNNSSSFEQMHYSLFGSSTTTTGSNQKSVVNGHLSSRDSGNNLLPTTAATATGSSSSHNLQVDDDLNDDFCVDDDLDGCWKR